MDPKKKTLVLTSIITSYISYGLVFIFVQYEELHHLQKSPGIENIIETLSYFTLITISLLILFREFYKRKFFDIPIKISKSDDGSIVFKACLDQFIFIAICLFLLKDFFLEPLLITISLFLNFIMILFAANLVRKKQLEMRRAGIDILTAVMIGDENTTDVLKYSINADNRFGFQIIKSYTIEEFKRQKFGFYLNLSKNNIKRVLVSNPYLLGEELKAITDQLSKMNIDLYIIPDCYDIIASVAKPYKIVNCEVLRIMRTSMFGPAYFVKRGFDICFSIFLLIILSPLLLLIAAAIKFDSPGPIIYAHKRVGKNGKHFNFYKFRSMRINADKEIEKLTQKNETNGPIFKMKNDPRITAFGGFLRKFSLDELPQLINIFKGEMSLIGPRPPVPDEVKKYKKWQHRRLSVIPGISGLWQVMGRSNLSFEEMVRLDIYYIENWSIGLDAYIFIKTIGAILRARGAY